MALSFGVHVSAWFTLDWLGRCVGQAETVAPLVVAPSGSWDGADGPWSTFDLAVGNPVQPFRCIPGITSPVVIVPRQGEWCNDTCAFFYGGSSDTWEPALNHLIPPGIWEYIGAYSDVEKEDDSNVATWGVDDVYLGEYATGRKVS